MDQLRAALENDNLSGAMHQVKQLTEHMQSWERTERIAEARRMLDSVLQEDVLAFDGTAANQQLERWASATEGDEEPPELQRYRQRIQERIQERQRELQIAGVQARSESLVTQANELERSQQAPHPNFLMEQYYQKALNIVLTAQAEYPDHTALEQLAQRMERVQQQKESAMVLYELALLNDKYSNALHNLEQIPADALIPRFALLDDASGERNLNYQGMVAVPNAKSEITALARRWAAATLQKKLQDAEQHLHLHNPQEAVNLLDVSQNVSQFLDEEQRGQLQAAKTRAAEQLRNLERAQELLANAEKLVESDALQAWDQLAQAEQIYRWVDDLPQVREAIVGALRDQLQDTLNEMDRIFQDDRDMATVRQMARQAQQQYANKDESLEPILERIADYDAMAQEYEQYVENGHGILREVQAVMHDDAVAANELLSQLEAFPEFVLEAFDNIYTLRTRINQRLNADQAYSRLYPALFAEDSAEVAQAVEETREVGQEFAEDGRFPALVQALQYHQAFLAAQQQFVNGAPEQALQLLTPVLNAPNHPDAKRAQALQQQILQSRSDPEEDEE
jgi:hypothetical protein